MLAILEVPAIRRLVAPISVEVYHQTPEYAPSGRRMELIRGVIIEKMPKSPLHATLLGYLLALVQAAAGQRGLLVSQDQPLTLSDSEPEPDICCVRGDLRDYRHKHPSTAVLAIEIAVTSEALDREKIAIYAEAGVLEYWIVLAKSECIEVYTEPRDGAYFNRRIVSRGEVLTSAQLPELAVALEALFAS